ncbi:MAG: cyclic nucleotide-binding domain-containing protein, partial [Verrucomicrobia bacterium]|nr:cyclic nucleotide-binding domain-containing protein [Verrucomicrobiota bacterium]
YTVYHPFDFIYWLIKAVLALDLLLCFNTSVKVKREVFRTRAEIGKIYLKTWFLPDLLAAFPFAAVLSGIARVMSASAGTESLFALTLLTLIRLFKIPRTFSSIQQTLNVNPSIMRLTIFGFWFALTAHLMALGWIEIGGGERTVPPFTRYLLALYWCITTIATIGYGDITPDRTSHLQLIYTMLVELVGVGMFGYIIANITSLVTNLYAAKAGFVKKTEEIRNYMRLKQLPPDLRDKVDNYYQYIWETRRSAETAGFLDELPHTLKMDIVLFLNQRIIEKVPLFKHADEIFIREVVQFLEPVVFLPEDYIIRQGEFGECMYFLSSGRVEVLANGVKVADFSAGSFFGESSLVHNEKRNASIKALEYCDGYRLSKKRFDELRQKFPEFDRHLQEITTFRRKEHAEALQKNERSSGHLEPTA